MASETFAEAPLLAARGMTKIFPGALALDGVDFTLRAGEVHALLGENGAGKSTLIKCLTGAYRRDGGTVRLEGVEIDPADTNAAQQLGIGTVYQEVNLLPNLPVADNLFLGRQPRRFGLVRRAEMRRRAEEILAGYGLGVDVGELVGSYSVAVQQIIAIARAVDVSGKVLILDEPTASLDAAEVEMLFSAVRTLKARGLGIVFISHFLDQVFRIADTVTVLRNGRLVGSVPAAEADRMSVVNMMLGRELREETRAHGSADARAERPVRIVFSGVGRKGRIAPFDLAVREGEVIGMAGLLGSGRTETAEILFGAVAPDCGTATVDGAPVTLTSPRAAIAQNFGFCPEERKTDGIVADLSVRENITLALQARRGWTRPLGRRESDALANDFIRRLDIRTTDAEKPVGELSGGNQQKVLLARWLATNPKFLILDEPTRGIDVGAHAEIIRLIEDLCAKGMSLLVISSELEELVAYSHRVIVLRDRRHVAELTGADVSAETIVRAIAAPVAAIAEGAAA